MAFIISHLQTIGSRLINPNQRSTTNYHHPLVVIICALQDNNVITYHQNIIWPENFVDEKMSRMFYVKYVFVVVGQCEMGSFEEESQPPSSWPVMDIEPFLQSYGCFFDVFKIFNYLFNLSNHTYICSFKYMRPILSR